MKKFLEAIRGTHRLIQLSLVPPILFVLYLLAAWNWPLSTGDDIHAIEPGSSMKTIAHQLHRAEVLPDSFSLRLLARLTGSASRIKAGEYRFSSGMNQRDILKAMVKGDQVLYSVLLVEGNTITDFLNTLALHPKLQQTMTGMSPEAIMDRLSYGEQHPEGRFFPDTYTFTAGTKDIEILRHAYDKMQKQLQREWDTRAEDLPYKNIYEALIMASIVEKETGRPEDRDRIAAVFVNRLRRNMKLQTDPTVIYGLGSSFDGNIRKRDLLRDTPYNTYTRRGLPPTPISAPGAEAIHAALHPAPTNDLYFVARGDGTSEFSETYRDHHQAVIKYQLNGNRQQ